MKNDTAVCTACQIVGIALGLLVVFGLAMNTPDIAKYIKLRAM